MIGKSARTLLSREGRAYRKAVEACVVEQIRGRAAFAGRLRVDIVLNPPTRRLIDIDNRIKAVLDALTFARVWVDDGQVDVLLVERGSILPGGRALVTVRDLATREQHRDDLFTPTPAQEYHA